MTLPINTRLTLLEAQVKDLRGKVPQTPSQEVVWRMWRVERELGIESAVRTRECERTLESVQAELEGLVLFVRGKPKEA